MGLGVATVRADSDKVLDVRYPEVALGADPAVLTVDRDLLGRLAGEDPRRGVVRRVVTTVIDLDAPPADAADAYLRLHLLSHRVVAPHSLAMDGIFATLNNVVWTNAGPCAPDDFEITRMRLMVDGRRATCTASTSSPAWSTTSSRAASASPTPTGCASAPTWPTAPP